MNDDSAYARLIAMLDRHQARYRVIDHAPEGRTDIVSALRNHDVRSAAKCLIMMAKIGKKTSKYILAVVPGDRRVDLAAVKTVVGATYVAFASADVAERLAGSAVGTILPFAMSSALELIADPALRETPELFFNAGRLDRSVALATDDYFAIAAPRVVVIAAR